MTEGLTGLLVYIALKLFGYSGWSWAGQHTYEITVISARTVFSPHNNQPKQYFGLFFSPAEQAQGLWGLNARFGEV